MKLMRSRFRLLSLLVLCAFAVTAVLCIGSGLKEAGISIPSSVPLPVVLQTSVPAETSSPSVSPGEAAPVTAGPGPGEKELPGDAISPEPEYNLFGL